jgi:hypothetical protein
LSLLIRSTLIPHFNAMLQFDRMTLHSKNFQLRYKRVNFFSQYKGNIQEINRVLAGFVIDSAKWIIYSCKHSNKFKSKF